jgi:hypothetical protein
MNDYVQSDEDDNTGEPNKPKYDLEERTATFAERVIDFAHSIQRNPVTSPLISQLVRSSTSIGANYCEADDAESKRDFRHKIGLCRRNPVKQSIGFACSHEQSQTVKMMHVYSGKKQRNCT